MPDLALSMNEPSLEVDLALGNNKKGRGGPIDADCLTDSIKSVY